MKSINRLAPAGEPEGRVQYIKNRFAVFSCPGLVFFIFLLTGCGRSDQGQGWEQGPAELPFAVVRQDTAVIAKEYAATIEGISNVEIRPQVSGYLSKIYIDEGDYVKAGQSLFRIEDRVFEEQLRNAQASLTSAEANLVTAGINLDRKRELAKSKVVSDLQVREAEAAYNAAKGTVDQAGAAVESAKINLGFSTIKAPVSGYVGRFNYRLGSLLSPTNAEPVTVLSDIRSVYAYFSMSENDFLDFQERYAGNSIDEKIGNAPPVGLMISNGSAYELPGKIDAVDGQFSRTTGSITLRARFDNPKSFLRTGNTGRVVLEQRYNEAVLLPIASTLAMQDRIFVFSVDSDNKAIQLPVQVSGKTGNDYILSGGLRPGDRYIVSGFDRLQAGTPVVEQKASENPGK